MRARAPLLITASLRTFSCQMVSPVPDEADGEDHALFHLEFSGQDIVFQGGVEFVQGDLGEEPQAPHVDPQDGEAQAAVMAGDAQDGAVAPHDHDEVGAGRQRQDGRLRFVLQVVGRQAPGLGTRPARSWPACRASGLYFLVMMAREFKVSPG